jgi:stage III sporulation protein SpoIIIAA
VQAGVLIEAVQNHTPDVIVCDEIGRKADVDAVWTVKQRGVSVIQPPNPFRVS